MRSKVTDENIRKLIRLRKETSRSIKENIVDAVKDLKNPQVKDIKSYLDKKAEEEVDILYSLGKFSSQRRNKELKRKIIVRETIQRNLNKLVNLRLIEHKGKQYFIPHFTKSRAVMAQPEVFGEDLLQSLMHFPSRTFEEGISELIRRFGILIGLCFLESMMPHIDKIDPDLPYGSGLPYDKRTPLTAKQRDELVLYWIHKVIPIRRMFDHFLSEVTIYKEASNDDLNIPSYELDIEAAGKVHRVIKKLFPDVYNDMIKHRWGSPRKGLDIL